MWAFEPTPYLINHLKNSSKEFQEKYHIIPYALSNINEIADFHIAGHHDWGCSSLNIFSEGLETTWPNRKDFYFTETISVQVCRFDSWYENTNQTFQQIDFFHCDTQGNDLKVLEGMGKYIDLIIDGVIEVPASNKVKLYKNQHNKEESVEFLKNNGFFIYKEIYQMNEINLYFKKS